MPKSLFYNFAVFFVKCSASPLRWFLLIALVSFSSFLAGCDLLGKPELTITWTTESELDIIGFNLFRSESESGPYTKINDELIPPASDPNVGGEHSYIDRNVLEGVTYYYKLQTVDRQGNTIDSDPIVIVAGP